MVWTRRPIYDDGAFAMIGSENCFAEDGGAETCTSVDFTVADPSTQDNSGTLNAWSWSLAYTDVAEKIITV